MPRCWIGPSSLPVTCSGRILPTSVRNAVGFASACFSTPNKRVSVTVATRNLAPYRDPAVIMIDQLKQVYIAHVALGTWLLTSFNCGIVTAK